MDNYGTGFAGFQNHIHATIEACDGDPLARLEVTDRYTDTFRIHMRHKRAKMPDHDWRVELYLVSSSDEWVHATDEDFAAVIEMCSHAFSWNVASANIERAEGAYVITTDGTIYRRHGDHKIMLAGTFDDGPDRFNVFLTENCCKWLEVVDGRPSKASSPVKGKAGVLRRCNKLLNEVILPATTKWENRDK